MEKNLSSFSLKAIIEKRESESKKKCDHDYVQGEFMGYDGSEEENMQFLFTCSKCNHSHVFWDESYFSDVIKTLDDAERKYRLEFNDKRKIFHLDNYTHEENTCGWVTICDITDSEFKIVSSYFEFFDDKKKTNENVFKFVNDLMGLIKIENK